MKTQYVRSRQRGEVPRPQFLWRGLATTCVLVAALAASFGTVARAANPPVVQKYYIPFPENDLLAALVYLWGERATPSIYYPVDPMTTIVTITAPASNTVIYYDHWEDGYETDLTNPQQATTQIWGDGNPANGSPPGVPSDIIQQGQVITLYNQLTSTTLQAVIDFDARDKIGASKAIAVTRSGWASQSNTLWAGAVEVFHTGMWGTDYRSPVGENIPQDVQDDQFDFVGFLISAGEGGATINIDKDKNGVFETTVTLAEGQSHFEHGGIVEAGPHSGVQLGGHVTSDNPIQVVLLTGDYGGFFETRDSSLLPTTSWTSSYYTPVSTPDSVTWRVSGNNTTFTPRTVVWLYNPNGSSITVTREYRNSSGSLQTGTTTITAGSYARIVLDVSGETPNDTGWHFYTTGSGGNPALVFYGWSATDAATDQGHTNGTNNNNNNTPPDQVNQGWDWSFSLIPEVWLSPQVICGLGIGRDPTSATSLNENGNPVWISTVGNGNIARTVYVDYNGNGVWDGSGTDPGLDPNGFGYDISYSLKELEQKKVYDPDGDQTGMLIYVLTDGVKLVAAWGQDPVNYVSGDDTDNLLGSSPGAPGLDVGTSVPPLPIADAAKTASVAVDTDGDGQASPNDTLEYDIRVVNTYRGNLQGPFVVQDTLPADTTYVVGSTKYRYSTGGGTGWGAWTEVTDGGTFPFAGSGLSIPTALPPREQIQIVFRARIDDYENLDPGRTAIVNTGTVGFTPYGFVIPLNASTPLKGSIGDRVWNDANNDQVQDAGEVGLNGVRVYADLDNDGVHDAGEPSALTSGDGDYLITNLPAGSYTVRVDTSTLPAGYGPTYDLDGIATPNVASAVALAAGQDRADVDFGYRAGASLGDRVWLDRNGNRTQEGGEPGINGVRVYIDLNNNDLYDAGEPNEITAGDGNYTIGGLAAGTPYNVRVDLNTLPGGLTQTHDLNGALDHEAAATLAPNENKTDVDFGYRGAFSLGDRVWKDDDADGIQDTVQVINGRLDMNGSNSISTSDDGWLGSIQVIDGYLDMDGDGTTNGDSGDDGSVQGYQVINGWVDMDGDGTGNNDSGDDGPLALEVGIADVRVYIDNDGDGVYDAGEPSDVTDADGIYTIGNLPPGTYTVRVDPASLGTSGYAPTYDLDGIGTPHVAVATIINANLTTVDFGYRDRASLGDRVWSDANNNGQQDGGEVGINGVR
ncbi:MAG TPA: SdrD B-like domain-containing protein, partial [Verrucomicrobiota bacterium]|nr:SdrD B-like domain-containing protein [Verrucomicrobiota bacterium]